MDWISFANSNFFPAYLGLPRSTFFTVHTLQASGTLRVPIAGPAMEKLQRRTLYPLQQLLSCIGLHLHLLGRLTLKRDACKSCNRLH